MKEGTKLIVEDIMFLMCMGQTV